jgi:hypothetical protein
MKSIGLSLVTITLILTLLTACDQRSISIQPEFISIEELQAELNKELNKELAREQSRDGVYPSDQRPLSITDEDSQLILQGSPAQISKALTIAKRLDIPSSYYLEVSNTAENVISTGAETMQVLIHPNQVISLGHITLIDSPWQSLIREQERYLELHLNDKLVLSINIKNQKNKQMNYYSGKHPMRVGEWLMAFGDSGMNQGKRIITSKPKKQLWLRLVKANSQSGIRLR